MLKGRKHENLSRREFVRLVSLSGTALLTARLLAACGPAPSTAVTEAAPSSQPDDTPSVTPTIAPTDSPEASSTELPTAAATEPPEPTPTWTTTPPAPEQYLPEFSTCGDSCPLPPPRTETGIPLMRALSLRASSWAFATSELPLQVISDLLWAAFGVNRPGSGKRTAPSAHNVQDIDILLATTRGLFSYDAIRHSLLPAAAEDLRAATGSQAFVGVAPLNLIYVSDEERLASAGFGGERATAFGWAHTGFIAQNVYLYCASEGLVTVVRTTVNREALGARLGLRPSQQITLVQTVGYPG